MLMEFTEETYQKYKSDAEALYSKFYPIKCQAIGGKYVNFPSNSFNHILYKKGGVGRPKKEQIMRFLCLDLAPKIVSITTTTQEREETLLETTQKVRKKKVKICKSVKYWGFIAIMHNKKVKVIIRQVGDGQIHFWSIIPWWRTTKHGDLVFRDFTYGNLEED